jgi:hypothetical protein
VDKVAAVFESYWHGGDFVPFEKEQFQEHLRATKQQGPRVFISPLELRPEPFQERMLEQLALARTQGHPESPTLFLQQLGRGLRRAHGKSFCTLLDFVGTHRAEFRFDRRLRALLGGTRREVEKQVEQGFPYLPAGTSTAPTRAGAICAPRPVCRCATRGPTRSPCGVG